MPSCHQPPGERGTVTVAPGRRKGLHSMLPSFPTSPPRISASPFRCTLRGRGGRRACRGLALDGDGSRQLVESAPADLVRRASRRLPVYHQALTLGRRLADGLGDRRDGCQGRRPAHPSVTAGGPASHHLPRPGDRPDPAVAGTCWPAAAGAARAGSRSPSYSREPPGAGLSRQAAPTVGPIHIASMVSRTLGRKPRD
jgi:hypothetical protein